MRVRILEDVPQFLAEDLREYGPFRKGDVVDIPPRAARVLIRRGLAEVAGGSILDWA